MRINNQPQTYGNNTSFKAYRKNTDGMSKMMKAALFGLEDKLKKLGETCEVYVGSSCPTTFGRRFEVVVTEATEAEHLGITPKEPESFAKQSRDFLRWKGCWKFKDYSFNEVYNALNQTVNDAVKGLTDKIIAKQAKINKGARAKS